MKKSDVVVIIPAYNEEKYLADVLKNVKKTGYDWVVVDDGSTDTTTSIAKRYGTVLTHRVNLGKGAALKTGCEYAFKKLTGKAVILMDSDGQHDPAELDLFLQALTEGSPVVFGARVITSEMPLIKILGNRFASVAIKLLYGTYIPDVPSGYKALTQRGYERVRWNCSDYRVELEIAVNVIKRKVKFSVVPIKTIYNDYSKGVQILDSIEQILSFIAWRFTK